MRSVRFVTLLGLGVLLLTSCSKSSDDIDEPGDQPPAGTSKSITVDVTYYSALIENSTSWATWPIVKFAVDAKAKSYKVRLYGFSGTFASAPEGIEYTWKKGELPPTPYNVFPSLLDIKDGQYYMSFGRTWCSGCSASDPDWIVNYKKGYGSPKAEVTYEY
jgi:hypothetical protein